MSQLPSDLPQLPKWPFLCADAVLLCTATLIASFSNNPTTGWPLIAVLTCVVVACVLCAIPFLTDYARSQDQTLDERQRALEGLAKTVSTSSEQISLAVQGLGRLDEQLQRHLRQIDQIPQKINERLGDLQQRLASSREGEIEELERELAALKASEGDRLESVMDQLQRATAEMSRLEQSAARHAELARSQSSSFQVASADSAARLTSSIDHSLLRSAEMISAALASARTEIDLLLASSRERFTKDFDSRVVASQELVEKTTVLAVQRLEALSNRLEQTLETAGQRLIKCSDEFNSQVATTQTALSSHVLAVTSLVSIVPASQPRVEAAASPLPDSLANGSPLSDPGSESSLVTALPSSPSDEVPSLPASLVSATSAMEPLVPAIESLLANLQPSHERSSDLTPFPEHKPTSEHTPEPGATPTSIAESNSDSEPEPAAEPKPFPQPVARKAVSTKKVQHPSTPVPAAQVPVAPLAAPSQGSPVLAAVEASPSIPASLPFGQGRQPRKKPEPVPAGMVMDLFNEHFSLEEHHHEPLVSRSVAADGATRIIVTAYIGIGNKLFVRGEGPGMSWERGVALQFVSIGKWRWDSLEAESSFRFKLYKNDHIECVSLGEQRIDVGQLSELTANF